MEKNLEKNLKRYLKRKVKITLGFIVAFLLGSSLSFADSLYIRDGEKGIEFSRDNSAWGENPYSENSFINNIYTNNIELNGEYGIYYESDAKNKNGISIINNSNISSIYAGIFNKGGKINNLVNNGEIRVENSEAEKYVYGIENIYSGIIKKLDNNGKFTLKGYYAHGIDNWGMIESLNNNDEIIIEGSFSWGVENGGEITSLNNNKIFEISGDDRAIGIENLYENKISNLTNNGTMEIKSQNGSAFGVRSYGTIELLNNNGVLKVIGNNGVTGIGNYYDEAEGNGKINNLTNNGVMEIETSNGKLWGINNNSSTIGIIENNGLIKATNNFSSGNSWVLNNYAGEIDNIVNNGNVLGTGELYITLINNEGGVINDSIVNNGNLSAISKNDAITIFNGNYDDYESNSIENIVNNGIMKATGKNDSNGIYNITSGTSIAEIEKIENNGLINISGKTVKGLHNSGKINELINNGMILVKGSSTVMNGVIGINDNSQGIKNIINKGMIAVGTETPDKTITYGINISNINTDTKVMNDGIVEARGKNGSYGIFYFDTNNTIELENNGIIFSSGHTIYGANANATNNGLLIGDSSNFINNSYTNNGMMFSYDKGKNNYKIYGVKESSNNIINATLLGEEGKNTDNWVATGSESIALNGETKENIIFNGITDTLKISGENILANSKVNGYTSAIVFDNNGGKLTLNNSIVNGGLDEESATISGGAGADDLILKNNSIINGDINLGAGNDNLAINNAVQINGNLKGGDDNDTLEFSLSSTRTTSNNINILHNISEFENINVNTDVTLFENVKVTGAEKITIGTDGNLVVRIDGNSDNSHALKDNKGIISSTGGKLLFALNGVGEGAIIDLGNNSLDETMIGNESGVRDITIDTTSLLHNIEKLNKSSVKVSTIENLPYVDILNYNELNKIYQSIRSVDKVGEFSVDNDKKLTAFTKYLHDIYAANPYAYSSELSRKTMSMMKNLADKDLNPELNKWAIYGGLTHTDGGTENSYYGKGYYTYDIGSRDISADTKISGGYFKAEYGKANDLTTGIIFGGNNSETEIGASKVEGDSFYFGTYAKKYINNFRFTFGAGFEHGDYKADRTAIGYDGITETRKYGSNYHDRGFNIYADTKYTKELGNGFYFEPSVTLEYSYVDQDGVSEDGVLAIETDSKNFDYLSGAINLDLRKEIKSDKFTHSLIAGVSYEKMLSGYDEEYITGRIKGGTNFDILVPEKEKDIFSLNAKYELETEKGFIFDVKGSYRFEYDTNKDEWIVGTGIGYKF